MIFEDKDRIVFAGDSVTDADKTQPHGDDDALGQGLGVGYVRFVYDMLAAEYPDRHIRITNSGVGGNTSTQLWKRWNKDVLDLNPDWVCIFIGINDVMNKFLFPERDELQVSSEEYADNLEKMIMSLENKVKGIFIISPYTAEIYPNDRLREQMDIYREIAKKTAEKFLCKYIDIQEMFDEYFKHRHQATIAWDRVHPNRMGAYMIAKAFLKKCDFNFG